jgi:Chaperone of endosialidase
LAFRLSGFFCSIFENLWLNGTSCASDVSFKQNIVPLRESLDKVLQLQGVTCQMKADEFPKEHFATGTHAGLIAQDVVKIEPEVVTDGPNGYKAMD